MNLYCLNYIYRMIVYIYILSINKNIEFVFLIYKELANMSLKDLPDDIIYTIYDNASLIEKVKMMYISKRIYILIGEMVYKDVSKFIEMIKNLNNVDPYIDDYIKEFAVVTNKYIIEMINDNEYEDYFDYDGYNDCDYRDLILKLLKIYDTTNDNNIPDICVIDDIDYFAYFGNKKMLIKSQIYNIKNNINICAYIAGSGNLEMLKWAYENGYIWDSWVCECAAVNGYLDCLRYAHEHKCPWDEWTCSNAAMNGYLDCLRYAYENGCPWDETTCSNAAMNGYLDCLRYAHENGCPWDKIVCSDAAINGYLDCLEYAHKNGCLYDKKSLLKNTVYFKSSIVEYIKKYM